MKFDALIRFKPIYQSRVWGGRRLETVLDRTLPDATTPFGESWELCDRPEAQSHVAVGPHTGTDLHTLWTSHREEVFGAAYANHPSERFPLLLKVLDASDDLSIQVHPPASVAAELGGEPKTEMWYIVQADPGAKLYVGLRPGVTRAEFEQAMNTGTVAELVSTLEPHAGESLFLPSGRLHAIGRGFLIYEIQQNSDTTYRVFDWNRLGLDGKPRALHLKESLASIDFTDFSPPMDQPGQGGLLSDSQYFRVRKIALEANSVTVPSLPGQFAVLAVISGEATIAGESVRTGEFVLIPAALWRDEQSPLIQAQSSAELLEVTL